MAGLSQQLNSCWVSRVFWSAVLYFLLSMVGANIAFAQGTITSPPSINGTYPIGPANLDNTNFNTQNTGNLTGLGLNQGVTFDLIASVNGTGTWNSGLAFETANRLRGQTRLTNSTTNSGSYDFVFSDDVWGLQFVMDGLDNGDETTMTFYRNGVVVPADISWFASSGAIIQTFDDGATLRANGNGNVGGPPPFGNGEQFRIELPLNVAVDRVTFAPTHKNNGSNGNVTVYWYDFAWAVPSITLAKVSNGDTGTFSISGDNGLGTQTIATSSPGTPVSAAPQVYTTAGITTTLQEAIPAGWALTNVNCTGLDTGGTFTPNLSTGEVVFNGAAVSGRADITCTFTNQTATDLQVIKSVPPGPYYIGSEVTFTIEVTNNGPRVAPNVELTDLLPTGIVLDNFTVSQGTYNSGSGLWQVGNIAINATETLTLTGTVQASAANSTVTNTVTGVAMDLADLNLTPDTLSASITVGSYLAPVGAAVCTGLDLVTNGGFEVPVQAPPPGSNLVPPGTVPGWSTTDSAIEIWESGFNGVPSYTNTQFAELNAFIAGTLTNTVTGLNPRAEAFVSWAHRGRAGVDTARLTINDNGAGTTTVQTFSTGNTSWSQYETTHLVGATGTTLTLDFTAVSTAASISVGNFLDTVEVCQTYITVAKAESSRNDADGSGTDSANDTITYQFTVSNPAGNARGLSNVEIVDDKIGTFTATPVSGDDGDNILEPGETWIVNADYTITQDDINAGSVTNVAFARGDTSTNIIRSDDDDVTASFGQTPNLTIVKTASAPGFTTGNIVDAPVGTEITYTYVVTNTGNITVDNITIADVHDSVAGNPTPANENLTGDTGTTGDSTDTTANDGTWDVLAPGDQVTFTATYTVQQGDVDQLQ